MAIPDRTTFESMYAGKAPWDIGRPQRAFVEVADRVAGAVVDSGCGTGESALFFAKRGLPVLGIDFLDGPIQEEGGRPASVAWTPSTFRWTP
jgi:hypothetical protein